MGDRHCPKVSNTTSKCGAVSCHAATGEIYSAAALIVNAAAGPRSTVGDYAAHEIQRAEALIYHGRPRAISQRKSSQGDGCRTRTPRHSKYSERAGCEPAAHDGKLARAWALNSKRFANAQRTGG